MFKCLCGGGTTASNDNTNNKPSKNEASINSIKNIANGSKKSNSLHPVNGEAGNMSKIQSTSNNTTPSPANHHINGLNKPSKTINKSIVTVSETDNDDTTVTSKSPSKEHKRKGKHVRKRTHPYKSRGDPHRTSISATTSPLSASHSQTQSISDYFVYDNFEFSIETFDFNLHYKFLIELAIKCLNMGPEILSPSIFYKHNDIVCCVAMLHQNNHTKVPISYNKTLMNNVIGFSICYPHSNCRPYPDSVWMIGWLCADNHRIRAYKSQYLVLEALIRSSYCIINPKATSLLPKITSNLKAHLRENRQINIYLRSNQEDDIKEKEDTQKKKKKPRDKGMGIYAPFHHKKAQHLYESLGFEKIAKIGNYYSTDKEFFDSFYKEDNDNKKKLSNDAYLYCRGDLAHCRLLLGMEYFNYKKWPKPIGYKEEVKVDEKQSKNSTESSQNKKDKDKKKRNYGPKILEEYLQKRIADYHAKQNEKILRNKQQQTKYNVNKLSTAQPTNSVATVHAPTSTNHSSIQKNVSSNKESKPQIAHNTHKAHHSSIHGTHRASNGLQQHQYNQNYQGHRSSGGMLYDKRIRYKQPHHANTHKYYDEYNNEPQANAAVNGTLSPNINMHHNSSVVSDDKGSRHSSIANSQVSHPYHATHNSGHSGHYYHAPHGSYHHQRPTFTQSSNAGSSQPRSSVTPTPTFDVTHSQAMYYPPHLSNVSTATYTHSMAEDHGIQRGNSFYSMASSNHSHHHSGAQSINSNASLHSDHPYHPQSAYHRHSAHHSGHSGHHHPQHYISHGSHHSGHHHDPYGNHQRHLSHHKHHESYNDDPYNQPMHHHPGHKARNKRYTRSSRHSSHKKLPQ